MTRTTNTPSECQAHTELQKLLHEADANGTRVSVLALARRLSMSNTTFRRHFPELAKQISAMRSAPPESPASNRPSRYDDLVARNAKLKRRNREITAHLALAAAHIQRITLENEQLRQQVEASAGITRLPINPQRNKMG